MALSEQLYRKVFVDEKKVLNDFEYSRAVREADESKRPLSLVLMERAYLSPTQFLQILADHFDVPAHELKVGSIDIDVLRLIPEDFATSNLVVAFDRSDNSIKVACEDPSDQHLVEELQQILQSKIELYVASEFSLRRALVLYDGDLTQKVKSVVAQLETLNDVEDNQQPTVQLLGAVIEAAVLMDASDIHIEPYESEIIIRFRIDGLLRSIVTVPKKMSPSILARLKVVAELKVDQTRLPQDGRFTDNIKGQEVNFRISTVPTLWGEKVVMRVLPREAHLFDLHNLGMLPGDLETVESYLKRPHGMILVTGPTGSGKTTTLYACLQEIGNDRIDVVNITTIEDPVEYTMPRITQIQTQAEIDLTFASGLRALLRQDPDVIMVGEIRDKETADSAIRSALVGRLVLSSLHTNDATSTIPRLLDMGIEPYLVSSTLSLVITQRLARRLCPYCRKAYKPEEKTMQDLKRNHNFDEVIQRLQKFGFIEEVAMDNLQFYKAMGCRRCEGVGYLGRQGIYEILKVTERLETAINEREDSNKIRLIALEEGMKTMFSDGIAKMIHGQLDLPELLRVAYS
ncbi:MAG TPA: GspE/PulE family protein [Candidatus Saccharimonadales bacterium]|nr:GspE/PulE family protein [Candidatus Saccharimonadales bacterium]